MRHVAAALLALALCACATGPMAPLPLMDSPADMVDAAPTQAVALHPATAERIEPLWMLGGGRLRYITGPAWASIFTGDQSAPSRLSVVDSRLEREIIALGFASRWTYSATAALTIGDEPAVLLQGSGYSHSAAGTERNAREAIAMALNSIARQAEQRLLLRLRRTQ